MSSFLAAAWPLTADSEDMEENSHAKCDAVLSLKLVTSVIIVPDESIKEPIDEWFRSMDEIIQGL